MANSLSPLVALRVKFIPIDDIGAMFFVIRVECCLAGFFEQKSQAFDSGDSLAGSASYCTVQIVWFHGGSPLGKGKGVEDQSRKMALATQ